MSDLLQRISETAKKSQELADRMTEHDRSFSKLKKEKGNLDTALLKLYGEAVELRNNGKDA